jgi:hypothetical protein
MARASRAKKTAAGIVVGNGLCHRCLATWAASSCLSWSLKWSSENIIPIYLSFRRGRFGLARARRFSAEAQCAVAHCLPCRRNLNQDSCGKKARKSSPKYENKNRSQGLQTLKTGKSES